MVAARVLALPGSMVALLSQPLLSDWYDDADSAERVVFETECVQCARNLADNSVPRIR